MSKNNAGQPPGVPDIGVEGLLRVAAEYFTNSEFARAQGTLGLVVQLRPTDARPWMLLGASCFLQEKHDQAINAYEEADKLQRDDPYTLVALVELYFLTLRYSDAVATLQRLHRADPQGLHPASGRAAYLLGRYGAKLNF